MIANWRSKPGSFRDGGVRPVFNVPVARRRGASFQILEVKSAEPDLVGHSVASVSSIDCNSVNTEACPFVSARIV